MAAMTPTSKHMCPLYVMSCWALLWGGTWKSMESCGYREIFENLSTDPRQIQIYSLLRLLHLSHRDTPVIGT